MKNTILFLNNTIRRGGAERVIVQLAGHFAAAGYHTVIITSFRKENEYPLPEGVERFCIEEEEKRDSAIARNIRRIRFIRKKCKQLRPSVLISFMPESNTRAIVATAGLKIKTIVSVRGDPASAEYLDLFHKLASELILPLADGCVFQTEQARAWFPARLQKKSAIIFNEVGEDFFSTEYVGKGNVVALGRLVGVKNYPLMIDAFASIADRIPGKDLLIYGEERESLDLEKRIADRHMQGRIRLMGVTKDSASVLKHASLLVLSSNNEGMPNVLLEAMAVGVPCVSTDCPCGGPATVIENGENGLLVPVGDVKAMADAILRVLSDPELAEKLSKNARASAERFRPDAVFEQWKSYVESVVGK